MKKKGLNELIRDAFAEMEREKKGKKGQVEAGSECLSEEILCEYLESKLSQSKRDNVEKHLSSCSRCQNLIITAIEAEELEKEEFKKELKDEIGKRIHRFLEPIKINLAWIEGRLKLINTSADYIPFWDTLRPALLRSASKETISTLPLLSKTYKGYTISLQIIEQKEESCNIQCQISPLSEIKPEMKIKADLVEKDRILCSYTFKKGIVLLSNIIPGDYEINVYEIKIKEGINPIATIPLNIKKD